MIINKADAPPKASCLTEGWNRAGEWVEFFECSLLDIIRSKIWFERKDN